MANSSYSNITNSKRESLGKLLDNFCSFTWRGKNSWDEYGVFIISSPGDLKFYNGPSFTNEYSSAQFESSSSNLLGVTFDHQKISFKIGMYWFSISQYREFLNWINPYEVDRLGFSFDEKYSYLVKLSSISDSPKYIVGYDKSEPMYYTEIDLSFDVQGEQCALSNQNNIIKFEKDKNSSNTEFIVDSTLDLSTPGFTTDLSTPIIFDCGMILQSETDVSNFNISLNCVYNSISYNLFSVVLKNIRENSYSSIITPSENLLPEDALTVNSSIIDTSIKNLYHICLRYVSEDGLLLIKFANEEYKLLSLQTTSGYGERIIDTMIVNKFKIPGTFESFGDSNLLSFNLSLSQIKNNVNIDLKDSDIYKIGPYISYYSRTNIA